MYALTNYFNDFLKKIHNMRKNGESIGHLLKGPHIAKLQDLDLLSNYMHVIEYERFMLSITLFDYPKKERDQRNRKLSIYEQEFNFLLGKEMPDDD